MIKKEAVTEVGVGLPITRTFMRTGPLMCAGLTEIGVVKMITDLDGNLLITLDGWSYPVIIYDVSREKIKYSRKKARNFV
jgi:hypothetical protein